MSIPNIGPEHADHGDHDQPDAVRRGNPSPVYRDEPATDDVTAASARASTVTHRFGGVRYALTRRKPPAVDPRPPSIDEGDAETRP